MRGERGFVLVLGVDVRIIVAVVAVGNGEKGGKVVVVLVVRRREGTKSKRASRGRPKAVVRHDGGRRAFGGRGSWGGTGTWGGGTDRAPGGRGRHTAKKR